MPKGRGPKKVKHSQHTALRPQPGRISPAAACNEKSFNDTIHTLAPAHTLARGLWCVCECIVCVGERALRGGRHWLWQSMPLSVRCVGSVRRLPWLQATIATFSSPHQGGLGAALHLERSLCRIASFVKHFQAIRFAL